MRFRFLFFAVVLGILASQAGLTQGPAGAPTGSTGQCNDGTYTNAPSKRGACRGHQGVKAWFAAAPASTVPAAPTAAPPPAARGPCSSCSGKDHHIDLNENTCSRRRSWSCLAEHIDERLPLLWHALLRDD